MTEYKKDPYYILQVSQHAEPEVIEGAYKRLAMKYHPDKDTSPEAHERMKELNWAYDILGNPDKKRDYDRGNKARQQSYQDYQTRSEKEKGDKPPHSDKADTRDEYKPPPSHKEEKKKEYNFTYRTPTQKREIYWPGVLLAGILIVICYGSLFISSDEAQPVVDNKSNISPTKKPTISSTKVPTPTPSIKPTKITTKTIKSEAIEEQKILPKLGSINSSKSAIHNQTPWLNEYAPAPSIYNYYEQHEIINLTDNSVIWTLGLCFYSEELLEKNWKYLEFKFSINLNDIDISKFAEYKSQYEFEKEDVGVETAYCGIKYVNLYDWPKGEYKLSAELIAIEQFSDGRRTYYPGRITRQIFDVTVGGENITGTTKKTPRVKSDYDIAMEGTSTEIISWTEAKKYDGEKKRVCGPVYEASNQSSCWSDNCDYYAKLTLGEITPKNQNVYVFYRTNPSTTGEEIRKTYNGKNICVTGFIDYYSVGPRIYPKLHSNLELYP